MRIGLAVAVGGALVVVGSAAEAQLIRQSVQGTWRECVYHGRPVVGLRRPRESLGAPNERVARVGRGEPCPQTYPVERRTSQRRPSDYVVLQ